MDRSEPSRRSLRAEKRESLSPRESGESESRRESESLGLGFPESVDVEKLHLKYEAGVGRYGALRRSHRSIAEIRRDDEPSPAADPHSLESLIPSAYHFTRAQPEGERLAAG